MLKVEPPLTVRYGENDGRETDGDEAGDGAQDKVGQMTEASDCFVVLGNQTSVRREW